MSVPSKQTTQTWTRLIRAQHAALTVAENALKQDGLPPLIWYDVLLELERADKSGLRPFELERELLLPQYGVSRLVEKIEKQGYLQRDTCQDDKRGQRLVITNTGKKLRRRMWTVYGPAIEDAVGQKLTPSEAKQLSELLVKLI